MSFDFSRPQSDRELLLEVVGALRRLEEQLHAYLASHHQLHRDIEERMRKNEGWRSRVMGGLALVVAIEPAAVWFLLRAHGG